MKRLAGRPLLKLLESVPNFSEGRRPAVVDKIVAAARAVPGVRVLDVHSDQDHNRSVLSLLGQSSAVQEAVFQAISTATRLIDLREHSGEHPRVGATDVVPFIPIGDSTMDDAVSAARALGDRVVRELEIPVYFYEEAATGPERQNLENIRRKGFEELREAIEFDDSRIPDLGPRRLHPSAGAIVIGARGPLIAYNIYLDTDDVTVAKAIAKAVRHSGGGLRHVKALGIDIPARRQVQVSMNLTNYRRSAVYTVFEMVKAHAESHGVRITHSEVVGLIPLDALVDAARFYLRLHEFERDQILESKLMAE
ncbi:MAG TPA: glutamate formimidoyltransferase [Chloroflexota bacterium]|nr:glutamate formimidoyltransferase [Chloroflexota bacterium]